MLIDVVWKEGVVGVAPNVTAELFHLRHTLKRVANFTPAIPKERILSGKRGEILEGILRRESYSQVDPLGFLPSFTDAAVILWEEGAKRIAPPPTAPIV